MEENTSNKIFWMGGVAVIAAIALGAYFFFFTETGKEFSLFEKPVVVTETVKIPDTNVVIGGEGWYPNKDAYQVPLAPKSEGEQVVVTGAVLTTRGAYLLALPIAQSWASDAKLVMIKSLSTVALDGKSQGWQVVFGSRKNKKGYEAIVERETIVSKKEIPSSVYGSDVPKNFADRDSAWAIAQLAMNPQFQTASMTGLNLTYSIDAQAWEYIIANSFGGSSVRVR